MLDAIKKYCSDKRVNATFGAVVTGDRKIDSAEYGQTLQRQYNAIAADQEIAAFSHIAYLNGVKFLAVKAVSDMADQRILEDQQRFMLEACRRANAELLYFIAYRHEAAGRLVDSGTS